MTKLRQRRAPRSVWQRTTPRGGAPWHAGQWRVSMAVGLGKVGALEKQVDSLALVTQTTLVLTILGSAAAAFRNSGLQLPV